MAENIEISLIVHGMFLHELIKRFIASFEHILFVMRQTAMLRPDIADSVGNPWMKHAEQSLNEPVIENIFYESVAEWCRAETVTMAKTEGLSVDFNHAWLSELGHAQLFKI